MKIEAHLYQTQSKHLMLLLKNGEVIVGYKAHLFRIMQWRTQEFCLGGWGGVSTNSVADRGQRERRSGVGSPLVRGSGGSCNLVQEISFHIVKLS